MFLRRVWVRKFLRVWAIALASLFSPALSVFAEDLSLQEFKAALLESRTKVQEFNELRKVAEKLGLRVYIMGGIASSYARYVSLDLKRQRDPQSPLEPRRFEYHWEQIFWPTQDVDLAVSKLDGSYETEDDIAALKSRAEEIFSGTKVDVFGTKSSFENRPALLNHHADFHQQNTDSVSNGLIELTSPGELQDIRFSDERFFTSFLSETISFHLDPDHEQTEKAKKGENPDFIAAVRLLINANRYGLSIESESLLSVKTIIETFRPTSHNEYVVKWIKTNAKKLVQQSIDLEKSFELIESTGMKKALLKIEDEDEVGSLHWLISREPFRSVSRKNSSFLSKPLFGKLKTAADLGISIVTHETPTYETYRQILFSFDGKPNAFLSKQSKGQAAIFGEGFYTSKGNWGGLGGSGFHIQMELASDAIEGVDFDVFNESIVLIYNRSKLKIRPPEWEQNLQNVFSLFDLAVEDLSRMPTFERAAIQIGKDLSPESRLLVLKKAEEYILKNEFEKALF